MINQQSKEENTTININFSSIFFQSYSIDKGDHPVYVFDSTFLPSFDSIGNKDTYDFIIDKLTDKLITKLPNEPYSLVAFTSGFASKSISWVYGIKMYAKLPQHSKNYLQKLYIVHESFWVRSVYQVLKNAMNFKFLNNNSNEVLIEYISDLSQLSELIDITKLRISLNVYLHDYEINEFIEVPKHYFKPKYDSANREYRQSMFDKIFKRLLNEAPQSELVFMKPGSSKKINVLLDIIDRNNYVDLSQWDIFSIAGVFMYFIKTKTKTFFPIDMITLPIRDDFEYTFKVFKSMMDFHNYYPLFAAIFPLFIKLIENQIITKHTYNTLSRCLVGPLCREPLSKDNEDRVMIGQRFIKNLLANFKKLVERMESHATDDHVSIKDPPAVPRPRKLVTTQPRVISNNNSPERHFTKLEQPPLPPPSRSSPKAKHATLNMPTKPLIINKTTSLEPPPKLPKPRNLSNISLDSLTLSRPSSPSPTRYTSVSPLLFSPTKATRNQEDDIQNDENIDKRNSRSNFKSEVNNDMTSRITDKPEATDIVTVDQKMVWETIKKLQIDNNAKIQTFDKTLQKQKQETFNKTKSRINRFSAKSYSDFKDEGNKVSRLASLYEERIQGIQILDNMKKNDCL